MTDFDKAIEEAKAAVLPYESWLHLKGETPQAYAAFCAYRDLKPAERNIKNAAAAAEAETADLEKRYRVWRGWAAKYRWRERIADYDRYVEGLNQAELRKTIEAQGEMHRKVTAKMLEVVSKKLDLMDPAELTQGNVTEWAGMAIKAEREAAGLVTGGKPETKQGEVNFTPDFQGI